MNNFTRSDRSYWWSITNLTCCSSIKSLRSKSMTALTLLMFFAFSSASFAQVSGTNPTGGGEEIGPSDGSMYEVPAMKSIEELMTPGYLDGFFDACHESDEDFVIHYVEPNAGSDDPDNPGAHDGEWGVATGFAKGSDHCSWTFYYVYSVKCANEVTPFTVKYTGGDGVSPWVPRHLKGLYNETIQDKTGLNVCYDDRPIAPTAEEIREFYTDNSEYVKVHGVLIDKRTRVKNDDCGWIEIHTYTVSDFCPSNTFEFSITYSGADVEAPEFVKGQLDLVPDMTVDCDKIPSIVPLKYTDNCAPSGRMVPVEDRSNLTDGCAGGYILRTYTIEDECGNKDVHQQRIDVRPAPKAQFERQDDIEVRCENRNSIGDYIPKLSVHNGMEGFCEISGLVTGVYDPAEVNCGSFDVTYTFTDDCDRVTTKVVTVTIIDEQDPGITYAARDLTVECDGAGNLEDYNNWVATMGGATAQDNCTATEDLVWSNNAPELPNTNECGMTGSTTVIFIVKDECGNQSKTYATFTIEDTTEPLLTPAINQTVVCDGEGNVDQFEAWLLNVGGATAKDDCSDVTWTDDFDAKIDKYFDIRNYLKEPCNEGSYTGYIDVVFTATDDCGLSSSTVGRFTIEDSIAPYITEAIDESVECDGNGNVSDYNAWINNNGGATLSQPDACSDVYWDHKVLDTRGDACDMYYVVEFRAYDLCGNESTTIGEFHILDTLNPMIGLEAQDYVFECNEEELNDPERGGQPQSWEEAFEYWLSMNGYAEAMDMCDKELTWTNNADDVKNKFNEECGNTGFIIVTFVATDDCGNNTATTAEFRIVDTKNPYLQHLEDRDLVFDDKCEADTDPSNTGFPRSYDDCSQVTVTYNDVTDKQACVTTITRTWTSTDECDNSTSHVQLIRIHDETAPELTGNIGQFNISNLDACEAPAPPSEADIAAQFSDACGYVVATLESTNVIADDKCEWAVQFVYNVKDNCGNYYEGSVKVTYWGSDQTKPMPTKGDVASGMSGINACLADALADYPGADADKELDKFTDDCSEWKELSITKSDVMIVEDKDKDPCTWEFYYEYNVYDGCRNVYTYRETYSGEDKLAPRLNEGVILSNYDITGYNSCMADAPEGPSAEYIAGLFDECGDDVFGQDIFVDRTVFSTGDDCGWLYSYEYSVYDACGNAYPPFKITHTGSDQNAPQWNAISKRVFSIATSSGSDCPADATTSLSVGDELNINSTFDVAGTTQHFYADLFFELYGVPLLSDDCTATNDIVITVTDITKTGDSCFSAITIGFVADDKCDNTSNRYVKVFEIRDDVKPTASAPADIVVQCADDVPAVDLSLITDEADNCQTPTVTHEGDVSDNGFPIENITRSYRISDGCGNYIIVSHNIKVEDTIAPEIECSGDIVVDAPAVAPTTVVRNYAGRTVTFTNINVNGTGAASAVVAPGDPVSVSVNWGSEYTSTYCPGCITQYYIGVKDLAIDCMWNGGTAYSISGQSGSLNFNAPATPGVYVVQFGGSLQYSCTATAADMSDSGIGALAYIYVAPPIEGTPVYYDASVYSDNCDPDPQIELVAGLASGEIFPTGDTLVTYKVTDASGNTATCSFVVTVNDTSAPTVANKEDDVIDLDFTAYPVPFNERVNVKYDFDFDTPVKIEVFDTKGLLVFSEEANHRAGDSMDLPLRIANNTDQLYYVKITTNKGTVTKKIVSSTVRR